MQTAATVPYARAPPSSAELGVEKVSCTTVGRCAEAKEACAHLADSLGKQRVAHTASHQLYKASGRTYATAIRLCNLPSQMLALESAAMLCNLMTACDSKRCTEGSASFITV